MPEQQNIEYKQSWHDDYLKWVCGFLEKDGGFMVTLYKTATLTEEGGQIRWSDRWSNRFPYKQTKRNFKPYQ